MMHVLVVEDEALIARRIERMTREILGDKLQRIGCVSDMEDAVAHLESGEVTLMLLDLNLSGQDGFDVLRQALAEPFHTIVISASTDRALEAFELGVVDFVPKPFTADRLAKAFAKIDRRTPEERRTRFLAVTVAGKVDLVPVESVIAVHGDDDYSSVETMDGRRHLHKKTLTSLEGLLPSNFERVHRSHIVNMFHAERIISQDTGGRAIQLSNGALVPIGRSYVRALAERLIE
jgi:two-component system, LytTR family, response regulator LytT